MRCEKHCTDLSSIAGVCASCLRQRLFRLIVAQEQAQAQSLPSNNCNSETKPALQRSVSPYISRQKSENSVAPIAAQRPYTKPRLNHSLSDQRFYSSPQIVLNTGGCIGGASSHRKKQSLIKFSSVSKFFRSNNRNADSDSDHRVSVSSSRVSCGADGNPTSLTSSPSWFPNVRDRQKKKAFYVDESSTIATTGVVRKQRFVRDRGMSPAESSDDGGDDELNDVSTDYESAESCKQTPRKTPANHTSRHGGRHRSVSELIFCLSPLVRASPHRLWSNKGKPPVDASGDTRATAVPHLSYAKSFCANRSRKLADFGRSDPNR